MALIKSSIRQKINKIIKNQSSIRYEVNEAIKSLLSKKPSKINEIPLKFFKDFLDDIGLDLLDLVTKRYKYFYPLIEDVLGHTLDDQNRFLAGLIFISSCTTNNEIYIDDLSLYLQKNKNNLDIIMNILTTYCEESGFLIN